MRVTLFSGRGSAMTLGADAPGTVAEVGAAELGADAPGTVAETGVGAATTVTWAVTGKPAVVVLSPMI